MRTKTINLYKIDEVSPELKEKIMDVSSIKLNKAQWEAVYYALEGALWLSATKQNLVKETEQHAKEVWEILDNYF